MNGLEKGEMCRFYKHGMSHSKFYNTYSSAKRRCENPHVQHYEKYGGRGIKFQWASFTDFRDDMLDSYNAHCKPFGEKETTLDRFPNRDGDYCKENCRWATRSEQSLNRDWIKLVPFNGKSLPLSEWATITGVSLKLLYHRIHKKKWSIERALSTPTLPIGRPKKETPIS